MDRIDFVFNKVLKTINSFSMIEKNDVIIVGVSGGADSVCLLHIIKRLSGIFNLKIAVVHINHGIRGKDSDDDQEYVQKLCENMKVDFFSFFIDIKKDAKEFSSSEEEAGRIFRYKCFYEVCGKFKNAKIAVAHNKNDNAETIIMRFIRGTGIKGLCGIPPVRKNIIRPLINCERYEIENYCEENNLDFRTDITNTMDIYTRNKIRLKLFPWISENLNKNIISTLSKNAGVISEEEEFLEKLAEKAFYECAFCDSDFSKAVVIDTEKFKIFDDVIKRRVIRKACRFFLEDLKDISYNHTNMVLKLSENVTGKNISLPSGIYAEKKYGHLIISKNDGKNSFYRKDPLYFDCVLMYNKIIRIDETGYTVVLSEKDYCEFFNKSPYVSICINKSKIRGNVRIRTRVQGDKIFVRNVGNKKLKNIFSEKKINASERKKILIVCDDENVISAVGIYVSDIYKYYEEEGKKINIYFWRTDTL